AAVANGGAVPPDLSLIAKARSAPRGPLNTVLDFFTQYQEAGPDYMHALLTGYEEEPPHGIEIPDGVYYNPYFLGGPALAMPPPRSEEHTSELQSRENLVCRLLLEKKKKKKKKHMKARRNVKRQSSTEHTR